MKNEQPKKKRIGIFRLCKRAISFSRKIAGKISSPLVELFNDVRTDFADRSNPKKTLIAMVKLRLPICVSLVAVTVMATCFFMVRSENTATTEMGLNYEESAYGLNPNSTRFNIYDISSQEVVEGMLSYSGIDPESVDIQDVIDCISVRLTNAKSFSENDFFISTSYKITLKKPSSIHGVSTEKLLQFLCKSYKDVLYSKYSENRSILDFDIDTFNDQEYMEIADLLDLKAQQIEKYLNMRVKQSKTFTANGSDETFKSLVQKVEDLRDYDIAKYRTFVITAGCSTNKTQYIRSLSYVDRIKNLSYSKDMAAYKVHNNGIKIYNESMISSVMIPSIDESKQTYYMSKTKNGMDYMAKQADNYLATAQETAKEIAINQDIMDKMTAGTNTKANIQKADAMIKEIRRKFSDLSRQIETVDKAYMKYKTKDYLTFKLANPSFLQKLQVSKLLILAAALLVGIYALIWLKFRYFSGGNKE